MPGSMDPAADLGLLDIDLRRDRLAHRSDVEVELVARPVRLSTCAAPPGIWSCSLWILLAMRRRASSRPSLCGSSTSIGSLHCCDSGLAFSAFQAGRRSIMPAMRWTSTLLLFVAAPAAAQVDPLVAEPGSGASPRPCRYSIRPPTTSRVGQDEPGYRNWYGASLRARGAGVKASTTISRNGACRGSSRPGRLLRTATSWQRCGAAAVRSPADQRMAAHRPDAALRQRLCHPDRRAGRARLRLSQPGLNACAGGAPESAHKHYSAIDMVPLRPITREELMRKLCAVHARRGTDYGRPRLLRLPSLPRRHHQVSRLGRRPESSRAARRSSGRSMSRRVGQPCTPPSPRPAVSLRPSRSAACRPSARRSSSRRPRPSQPRLRRRSRSKR